MPIYVLLAAVAVAIAIPLALVAVGSGESSVFARRQEKGEKVDVANFLLEGSAGERVVLPAFSSVFRGVRRITPAGIIDALDRRIQLAGLAIRPEPLLMLKVVLGAAVGLAMLEFFDDRLYAGLGAAAGFLVPDALVGSVAKERQNKILIALPQVIDQLRMSVEAGVGFEAAVGRAAKAGSGPLADELRRTLQEMQIGASRTEALHHLADRNDVSELRTFVAAVSQSEDYGIPVAHVLRVQADELRTRRKQRAEERAMKIPVKMVFPLVLCIFPALMIVLLGPAGLRIVDALL
ncbi:MAG: type II secretion system F family protein [Acidimicrobiia bacterium]|nr:type II secretion system F family protein [Acidimicrobiia bacterium]